MTVTRLFAELAVSDHEAAVAWYAQLFGRPADARPMDGLAEWHFPQTGGLQVFLDPGRAGRGLLTLGIDDLEVALGALAEEGVVPVARGDATSLGVPFATIEDPDGNAITLVDAPG